MQGEGVLPASPRLFARRFQEKVARGPVRQVFTERVEDDLPEIPLRGSFHHAVHLKIFHSEANNRL
jgi:hypothetical protein